MTGKFESYAVPNMSKKILTVRAVISPTDLGVTLMHEHIFLDLRKTHLPHPIVIDIKELSQPINATADFPATELALWESKVGLGNLHMARDWAPISDNYVLSDEHLACTEVNEFKKYGGNTIVDVTSIGLNRDPKALRRLSETTGLNIVMGTGYYQPVYHPENMDDRSVDGLTDDIVSDVVIGVADTGIRAGLIGEIGVNGNPIIPNEVKSIAAASRASRLTGAAISFHMGPGTNRHETLNIAVDQGAALDRIILGHSDEIASDLELMLSLLERGVYIEFDHMGRETALGTPFGELAKTAMTHLVAAGHENRILLSHDVCMKIHLKHYGGNGYSFIPEKFLPYLLEKGISSTQINKFMVDNPAKILQFVSPKPL